MKLMIKLCGQGSFLSDMRATVSPLHGMARESLFLHRRGLLEDPLISTGRLLCFLAKKLFKKNDFCSYFLQLGSLYCPTLSGFCRTSFLYKC